MHIDPVLYPERDATSYRDYALIHGIGLAKAWLRAAGAALVGQLCKTYREAMARKGCEGKKWKQR